MFFDPNSTREYLAAILFLIIQLRNPCTGVAPRSLCQMSQAHGYLRPHPRHRYAREPFKTVAKEIELARLGLTQFSSAVDRRSLYKRRSTLIRATPAAAAYLRGRSIRRASCFIFTLVTVCFCRTFNFCFPVPLVANIYEAENEHHAISSAGAVVNCRDLNGGQHLALINF